MFAAAQIDSGAFNASILGLALAITSAGISAAASIAFAPTAIAIGQYATLWASSWGAYHGWGIARTVFTGSRLFLSFFAEGVLTTFGGASAGLLGNIFTAPISFALLASQFRRAGLERLAIITTAWGAGRKVGVQIQYRRSRLVQRTNEQGRPIRGQFDAEWDGGWATLSDDGGTLSGVPTSRPILASVDDIERERLLQTQWIATYSVGAQADRIQANRAGPGAAVQFRLRPLVISALPKRALPKT